MRRGGAGGAAAPPPPAFGQLSFLGSGGPFFWAAAMVGGGCFSIFRRADDVTQTMSKGGVLVKSPPPFRKSCIRPCYLCKILGSQPLRPPLTKAVPYAYGYTYSLKYLSVDEDDDHYIYISTYRLLQRVRPILSYTVDGSLFRLKIWIPRV